jgi:hypothetical protein
MKSRTTRVLFACVPGQAQEIQKRRRRLLRRRLQVSTCFHQSRSGLADEFCRGLSERWQALRLPRT